ncbi:MAG: hypothetical protein ACRD2W_10430, partial [Acidimicrobiales bacterium]
MRAPRLLNLSGLSWLYPNQGLSARVVAVDTTSTVVSNVVTYGVTLDNVVEGVKPGMTAPVSVLVASKDGALNVPTAAVRGSGANATVRVLADAAQTSVPVVVGLRGDTTVEIVSGLKAGDQVVVSSGATAAGGGAVRLPTGVG